MMRAAAVQDRCAQQAAEESNQQRELLKAMLSSGNPKMQEMAMAMSPKIQAMMPKKPPSMSGCKQRFMNLGEGLVFDMSEQSVMDFKGREETEGVEKWTAWRFTSSVQTMRLT